MKKNELLNLLGFVALTGGVVTLSIIANKRSREKKSNFIGSRNKVVTFVLVNNTTAQQNVTLFSAYTNAGTGNPAIKVTGGNLQYFTRSLLNEQKRLDELTLRFTGTGSGNQMDQPLDITCKDASGQESSYPSQPQPSAYQPQGNMVSIRPNLLLDGQCTVSFTIMPKTRVSMSMKYTEMSKS